MKSIRNLKFRIRNYSFLAAVFTFSFLLFPSLADASAIARPANNLGLVGYWSFEDATGTKATDFSGRGNTGTLNGGASWINGKRGKALTFDGSGDYVSSTAVATALPVTMCAWFKTSATDGETIMSLGANDGNNYIDVRNTSQVISLFLKDGTSFEHAGSAQFALNTWNHVCGLFATSTMQIYLNGSADGSAGAHSKTPTGIIETNIGRLSGVLSLDFTGSVDEVRVYNRILSATEVTALYGTGAVRRTNPNNRGLVGYWSFEDGTSTQATDFSGKGYTGTLTNGPTWVNGKRGKALSFDGSNDHVLIPSSSVALDNLSEVTWSAWIKRGAFATSSYIMEKGVKYAQIKSDDTIEFRFMCNTGFGPLTGSTNTITDTNWHHIVGALSFSGDGLLHIYLDGVEVSYSIQQGCFNGIDLEAGNGLTIGISNSLTAPFNGQIDEVRVYNRALSAAEAASLYAAGASTLNTSRPVLSTSSLVLWHTFDGPYLNTTTSTDRSGQSNHGTLAGTGGAQNKPQVTIGKSGQALNFDGADDQITIPDNSLLNGSSTSISAWIKRASPTTGEQVVYYPGGYSVDFNGDSQVRWSSYGGLSVPLTVSGSYGDTTSWHHYVWVADGTNIYIYYDSVLVGSTASVIGTISGEKTIGSTGSRWFNGSLDDLRIYNTALTAAEVKKLYDAGK